MIGLEAPGPGSFNFHAIFFSGLHSTGIFVESDAIPEPLGPRNLGQSPKHVLLTKTAATTSDEVKQRPNPKLKTMLMTSQ